MQAKPHTVPSRGKGMVGRIMVLKDAHVLMLPTWQRGVKGADGINGANQLTLK